MSLENWLADKLIEIHHPSAHETKRLLAICDRDLEKCCIPGLGPDWKLSIAYNAALTAAMAALSAAGYRARKDGQHYRVIQSLAYTIKAKPLLITTLDKFRQKRNISDYEMAGMITEAEAEAMLTLAKNLRNAVEEWLKKNHPELL
ncbi:MAG: hypothetical protein C4542_01145 [Dehalococcoidia bacterium]|nr:MAG: hypothetical protein C4542_01145 [Dehalococcoidia bacterium]